MNVFTYSDARQRLSELLDQADLDGKVFVQRKDGRLFSIQPERKNASPFNVRGINTQATTQDILEAIQEGRTQRLQSGK